MRSCFAKAKHVALLAFPLFLAGCDSNSERSSESFTPTPKPSAEFTITGAVEFFPVGAQVAVYPVSDGRVDRTAAYASVTTDDAGRYQLTVPPAAADGPVVLEAVAEPGSATVRCPLLSGCGNAAFGADVALEGPLTVSAPVKSLTAGGTYNLTMLTTVLAETVGAAGPGSQEAYLDELEAGSLWLADRFEIFGELAKQPLLDWTQGADFQGASMDGLRVSAVGSAAVAAWCAGSVGTPLSEAFDAVVVKIATEGLAATSADGSRLNELALNQSILDLAAHWRESAPLAPLISERRAASAVLELTQQMYAVPLESPSPETSESARTKRFIDDIRQAGTSVNQKQLSSFRNLSDLLGADGDLLERMGIKLDGINLIEASELDQYTSALSEAFGAMMSVLAEHFTYKPISNVVDGIDVSYADYGDYVRVGVNQLINACEPPEPACEIGVNVSFDVAIELVEASAGINFYRLTQPNLKLFGRLSGQRSQLVIPQSNPATLVADEILLLFGEDPNRPNEDAYRFDMNTSNAHAKVPFSLQFDAVDERTDSDYVLALGADDTAFRYNSTNTRVGVEIGVVEQMVRQYRLFNTRGVYLDIAGKGADLEQGPQFGFSLAVENSKGDEELRIRQTVERQCTLATAGRCDEVASDFSSSGEDFPPALGMTATVLGRARLDGYAGPVWLKFSGSRVDHTTNAINFLTVSQPGNALWLNGEFNNDGATQLDAYNRLGYYFDIHRDGSMRDGGVYSPAGELVVELKDMGTWIKLTYPDGTFDSI